MSRRDERLEAEVGIFMKKYARRKHAGYDPNDRTYDRSVERAVKRMDPRELDAMLRAGDDDLLDDVEL